MNLKLFIHPKVKIKILISQFIAVIPFLIFIFILIDLWYDTRRTLILEQNISVTKTLESYISETLNHSNGIASTLAQQEIFEILDKSGYLGQKEKVKSVLKIIQENQANLHSVSLFDPQGNLIETSYAYSEEKAATNISNRDYFLKAVRDRKTVISDPLIGRMSNEYIVIVASPIIVNNNLAGVILVNFNLNQLKKELEAAINGQNRRIFLIDGKGNIIMELNKPFPDDDNKNILKENYHIRQALKGEISRIDNENLPISPKIQIGYAFPVKGMNFNWVILSVNSTEEIYSPIIKFQSFFWLIFLSSILFILSVISYFLRKIKIIY